MATRRACAIAGGTVALLLCLPLAFGRLYYGLDLTRTSLGVICAIQERLARHASLDLSPLLGNGAPLLARPEAALFYPPRWMALALPPDWALAFEVILHLAFAAATTAWLARTFRVRPFTAAAVGITFALSGTAIDLIRHANYIVAAAWLPLVWAGCREALLRRGGRWAMAAVFVGLVGCLLGAEPQSFAVGVGLIGVELIAAFARHRRPRWRWLALGACIAAAYLVGLVQWAPTLAEMALTSRAGNLRPAAALSWSLVPPQWLGVVLPGMPSQYVQGVTTLFHALRPEAEPPWNKTPYLGPLVLSAAFVGLWLRRARPAALVALGATLFSLGGESPVLPVLMKALPFLARFRSPSKYWLVASLAILILAAIVIDGSPRKRRWRRLLAWSGGTIACALAVFGAWVALNAELIDRLAASAGDQSRNLALPTLSGALGYSALEALVPLVLGLLVLSQVRLRRWAYGLVVLGTVAALPHALLIGPGLATMGGSGPPPALPAGPDAVVCVHRSLERDRFAFSDESLDWNTMAFLRAHLVPPTQACSGVRAAIDYTPLETTSAASLANGVAALSAAAIRAVGCTHFVSRRPFLPDLPASSQRLVVLVRGEPTWGGAWVFELPDPLPPVFLAREAALSPDERDALARVARARSRDDLLRVVDDPLRRWSGGALPAGARVLEPNAEWDAATSAVVRVAGDGGAVVALRVPFLVGWEAAQAGKALPVVRVAAAQLAAVVEDVARGPIEFHYRTPRLATGIVAAVIGLLLLGGTLIAAGQRPRRP